MATRPVDVQIPPHIKEIIQQNNNTTKLVARARELADSLQKIKLTNTQIRQVYASVKRVADSGDPLDSKNLRLVKMLQPRLAYAANKNPKLKELARELTDCIVALEPPDEHYVERFRNFTDFLEAIVAYHYEPKD